MTHMEHGQMCQDEIPIRCQIPIHSRIYILFQIKFRGSKRINLIPFNFLAEAGDINSLDPIYLCLIMP